MEYTHTPLGEDVEFLAGSYSISDEERITYNGTELLYLMGQTSSITSCCGVTSPFSFIKVVGKVNQWQHKSNEKGLPVSEIDLVRGDEEQKHIRELVHQRHPDIDPLHIEFW
ncbi:hypothetical protein ACFLWX_01905 [Chloroflexota bacterium]